MHLLTILAIALVFHLVLLLDLPSAALSTATEPATTTTDPESDTFLDSPSSSGDDAADDPDEPPEPSEARADNNCIAALGNCKECGLTTPNVCLECNEGFGVSPYGECLQEFLSQESFVPSLEWWKVFVLIGSLVCLCAIVVCCGITVYKAKYTDRQ